MYKGTKCRSLTIKFRNAFFEVIFNFKILDCMSSSIYIYQLARR